MRRRLKKALSAALWFIRDLPERLLGGTNTYGPSRADRLGLTSLDNLDAGRPFQVIWPLRIVQFIGGKRWSLAVIIYQPTPILVSETREGSV